MIWFRPELRVLFVCTANVCRSPLAEAMLRHRLRAMGLARRVKVLSAGSSTDQSGRRPDPRVAKRAAEGGISLRNIRTRKLTLKMIRQSDYILVMEQRHLDDIDRLCSGCDAAESPALKQTLAGGNWSEKVQLLSNFLPLNAHKVKDIPDPYFGDSQSFDVVYELIDLALTGFLTCVNSHFEDSRDSHN